MRGRYEIGAFRLNAEARVLTYAGEKVTLGARAVAVLGALVAKPNEYITKIDLMDAAWPGVVVEEANLAVQISSIRRALARVPGGDRWIETAARRGYRFVGPVAVSAGASAAVPPGRDRLRSNLPHALTSFVGRERELAYIKLALPDTRLLTLTGTGGIGKTRLALQAAAEVHDAYPDGTWFVDLAPLTDAAQVPGALAHVLRVKEAAGETITATLCAHLRRLQLLLVLDNCEHVLGACADLSDALLRETAGVSIIATSRQALAVATELAIPVAVLPLPDPKAAAASIARSDAVQLFVDRARQHRPRFDLLVTRARTVAEICVRLDGLPLALELAAARVAMLPVEEILRLLDQRFRLLTSTGELARQQTLRAVIDWSHELLLPNERQLFARLSVFAGGWTLALAEAVAADAGLPRDDVVYLQIALIEKSLVVASEAGERYRMLETLRQYAGEKLAAEADADAVRARFREQFLALAEAADPELKGAEQGRWLTRLDEEHANLREAMQGYVAGCEPAGALRLCGALQRFWMTRGHLTEGRAWCARCLALPGGASLASQRANVLHVAGTLAHTQTDFPAAKASYEESLALRRELGDRRGVAQSLNNLAVLCVRFNDLPSAQQLFAETLAILRDLGDSWGVATALGNLGRVLADQGHYDRARAQLEESLALKRRLGDRAGVAFVLMGLAEWEHVAGQHAAARAFEAEAISIQRELGSRTAIVNLLNSMARWEHSEREYATARAHFSEALRIACETGDQQRILLALAGLADVAAILDGPIAAARQWGAARELWISGRMPDLLPHDRAADDSHVAAARAALGDDAAFDRAWAEGRDLSLEAAIEVALGFDPPSA